MDFQSDTLQIMVPIRSKIAFTRWMNEMQTVVYSLMSDVYTYRNDGQIATPRCTTNIYTFKTGSSNMKSIKCTYRDDDGATTECLFSRYASAYRCYWDGT
jgi:hypothetical protein